LSKQLHRLDAEMAPLLHANPVHFPSQEMQVALRGKAMDPNAGSWTIDPVFDGSSFKFGYLVSNDYCYAQADNCSINSGQQILHARHSSSGVLAAVT